jgi:hypothetical protein
VKPRPEIQNSQVSAITEYQNRIDPKVINLSNRMLTKSEIKLLIKGLKFTLTPKSNHKELKTDSKEYTRKLRLVEIFHNR